MSVVEFRHPTSWLTSYLKLSHFFVLISLLSPMDTFAQPEKKGVLHLATEHFPPFSMTLDGSLQSTVDSNITGSSVDIIRELMRQADQPYTLELVPWKRAYTSAMDLPQHGVFSTTLTEAREPLFRWVTPLARSNWVLFALKDVDIQIESLDDAKGYRTGGYLEDAIAAHLEKNGFKLDYVRDDTLNLKKLARKRIDLWPVVELKGRALARTAGVEIKKVWVLKSTEFSLALNRDTDPKLVRKLNDTLATMYQDGTVDAIMNRY